MKNIKKIAVIFVSLLLLALFAFTGYCAADKTYSDGNGNTYTYTVENGEVTIEKFSTVNETVDLVIPSCIDGYPVTNMEYRSFRQHNELKSVVFPETLSEIRNYAFSECENLESISLPESLKIIDDDAFSFCGALSSALVFGKNLESIGQYAFGACPKITSISFTPDCTCTIHDEAFISTGIEELFVPKGVKCGSIFVGLCENLKTVNIEGEPLSILYNDGYYTDGFFEGCINLETVILSDKFELTEGMFYGCENLKSVHFGKMQKPTEIAAFTFTDCKLLSLDNINISFENVTFVGERAFQNCENMVLDMQRDFPKLETVEGYGFAGCKKLSNLFIKDMTLGNNAFEGCTSLKSVKMSNFKRRYYSRNINKYAINLFKDCSNLEEIIFFGEINTIKTTIKVSSDFTGCNIKTVVFDEDFDIIDRYDKSITLFLFGSGINSTLNSLEKYEVGTNKLGLFSIDGVLYKRETDENGNELITLISYPMAKKGEYYSTATAFPDYDGYFTIADYSFRDTQFLKYMTFVHRLLSYDDVDYGNVLFDEYPQYERAFYKSSVEEITFLENGFDYIQSEMFDSSNIRKIDLSGTIGISSYAFCGCKNLQTVDLPNVTSIGKYAFCGCTGLKKVNAPKCVSVGNSAFALCEELKSINIPYCIGIGTEAFLNCKCLTQISLIFIQYIDQYAFKGCEKLSFVFFGWDKCKIDNNAFANCPNVAFYCGEQSEPYLYAEKHNIPVLTYSLLFYNGEDTFEYTGKEIRPAIIVAFGDTVLAENRDYVIEYFNNTEVSDKAYITVHFIGNFEGLNDVSKRFYIVEKNISSANILYVKDNVYDGEDIRPAVVVILDGKELLEGTDYDIIYQSGADTGTMLFTVMGKGNYKGEVNCYYNIIRRDIAEAKVEKIPDQIYTGEGVCPSVVIKWNGFTLAEGEDFEVRYFENVNAGYATAVIYGKGNFCGTLRVQFKIFGKDISAAEISEIPDTVYTGSEIKPNVTVMLDSQALVEGADYTLSYDDNTESGTATVTVSGMGNYSGVIKKTFNIYKNSVYSFTVFSETQLTETFNGSEIKPEMEVYFENELLTEGLDYEIALENNISAGTATVTVIGIGRFEGERSFNFTILPLEINKSDISVSGSMEYNGAPVMPEVSVTVNGTALQCGTDYIVEYTDNNAVGTAYMTIYGIGNYANSVTLEYEIYSASQNTEPSPEISEEPNEGEGGIENEVGGNENTEKPQAPSENKPNVNPAEKPQQSSEQSKPQGTPTLPQIPNTDAKLYENSVFTSAAMVIFTACGVYMALRKRKIQE